MALRVYVAAPLDRAAEVELVYERLLDADLVPVSRWPYDDASVTAENSDVRRTEDLFRAHVVLVLARPGPDSVEMLADVERALMAQTAVVWTGDVAPSRPGIRVEASIADAITLLRAMSDTVARPWPRPGPVDRETLWRWVLGERETSQELPRRTA